jgi:hypothetical protein
MKLQVAYLAIVTALLSTLAHADTGFYGELGVSPLRISGGGFSATPGVAIVRFGYDFTRNLGVEAIAATTFHAGSLSGVDIKVESAFGGYLKGRVELAKGLELFARAGYVTTSLAVSGAGSASDSSFSYAIGAQYRFTKTLYAQADYGSLYDHQGLRIAGPSLSFGMRF